MSSFKNYVIVNTTDLKDQWILGLELRTEQNCKQAIRWQSVGTPTTSQWSIVDKSTAIQMIDAGQLDRACYTERAWDDFKDLIMGE